MIALLSGVLLILVFPGFNFAFLAPIALVPLFYAVIHVKRRVLFGWLTGVMFWFGVCYWIQGTLQNHGGMGTAESWALFVLFSLAKGLQLGALAWVMPFVGKRWYAAPALAALWTAVEWTHNYTGFAWLVAGNVAADWGWLAKLAPFTGVWGISFLLALTSAVIITRQWLWLGLWACLFVTPALPDSQASFTAFAVQPNISEETVFSSEGAAALERHLEALSSTSIAPKLVVWPEVPAPIYDHDRLSVRAPLLAGVVSHNDRGEPLNSAILLSAEGRFVSRYDKVNLVPFGEFVPWPFGALTRKVSSEAGEFASGERPVVAQGIGTFICYESVFPNYIRQFPLIGAKALFNLSNDSWFAKSAARDQHFLIARMRAIENRRWIVRVTNNGITASIDPLGRAHDVQPSYQEVAAPLHYGEEKSLTLYTQWGDWFVYLCILGLACAGAFELYSRRRPNRVDVDA